MAETSRLTWSERWRNAISVDLRSLALFRVAAAALLLWDLGTRLPDLAAHYSDAGVLPRAELAEVAGPFPGYWPHYYAAASPAAQAGLFAVHMAAAGLLLAGWRTRVMAIVCWGLLVSLHHRNDFVLGGGDALLRLMLFWGMFLPLGARASLDAWAKPGGERRTRRSDAIGGAGQPARRSDATGGAGDRHVSFAGFAALMQLVFMYVFTALMKNAAVWYDGTALGQALLNDYYVSPLGAWLREQAGLLPAATTGTLILEFVGPLLILSPVFNAPLRIAMIVVFGLFHAGIWMTMNVAIFSQASLVAWTIVVPTALWERLGVGRGGPAEDAKQAGRLRGLPGWLRPARDTLRVPVAARVFAVVAFVYITLLNIGQLPPSSYPWARLLDPPAPVKAVFHIILLDQRWSMFAPEPRRDFAWYVIEGEQADGTQIDLLAKGRAASFEKPASLLDAFPSMRWRIYMTTLFMEDERSVPRLAPLARWFAREWNAGRGPGEQVRLVRVHALVQHIADGRQSLPERKLLLTYDAQRDRATRPQRSH